MHKGKLLFIALASGACSGGGTPTNFAGSYTITVVDGADNCNVGNGWTSGNSVNGISATISQDGAVAQLTVNGLVGGYLSLVVGTNIFSGDVKGDTFTATLLGTKTQMQGACSYTTNTKLQVSLDTNNVISGTIDYTPATNNNAACGVLSTCTNTQTVSGSRTGP